MRLESGALGRATVPSGASTGRARGGRAARRRERSGAARASRRPSRTSTARSRRRCTGVDAADQEALDRALIDLDGTPNKGRLGANAILGASLAAAKACGSRRGRLAVPLPRRRRRDDAARADDERDQRRRARRELDRPAGVHGRPGRRRDVRRGAADRRRGLPRAEEACCTSAGSRPASATKAASRPTSPSSEAAIEAILEAAERAGPPRPRRDRARPGDERGLLATAPTASRDARLDARRDARLLGGARRPLPDRLDRGRRSPRTTGRRGRRSRSELGERRAARRRRPVRDEPGAPAAGDRRGRRQLDPRQGQPDRHAHRDDRGDRAWRAAPATRPSCRTARARPRTRRSPTSRSRTDAGQIKTGAPARSDRVAKYNQLLRIEEELGDARAVYPGWAAFPRAAPLTRAASR